MKKLLLLLLLPILGLFVTSCCKDDSCSMACATPKMDIREFFNGSIDVVGVCLNWCGHEQATIKGDIDGTWSGNNGTVVEHLTSSCGHKFARTWSFTATDDNHFTGTADGVIGKAKGKQKGNACFSKYEMTMTDKDGKTSTFDIHDHCYLVDDNTAICISKRKKWGLPMGQVIFVFHKSMVSSALSKF